MEGKMHLGNGKFGDMFGDIFMKALESISDNGVEVMKTNIPSEYVQQFSDAVLRKPQNQRGYSFCAYNVYEDETNVYIMFDIPGVHKKDVKLEITKTTNGHDLSLTVNRVIEHMENKSLKRQELFTGVRSREVPLPSNILTNDIFAKHENGVLYVTIKKVAKEQPSMNIPIL